MRTKIAVILGLALAGLPAGAMAAKPSHPSTPASTNANGNANGTSTTGKSSNASANAGKVQFVIHGTVTAYTPANGTTNGSIWITFKSSNFESSLLKGATQPLMFTVGSSTKIVLHNDKAIASGDNVIVKVRAAKTTPVATLATLKASQIIDQG